jgi:hypothetical protein
MKKSFILAFFCLFILSQTGFGSSDQTGLSAQSKPIVDYRIKAKLLPKDKAVIGHETLTWLNDSDQPISELQFHLYLNAFKDNNSTFMKESGGVHRGFRAEKENWGRITITNLLEANGTDLLSTLEYIQPDDGNKDDQTVARVRLPEPVLPHKKITLQVEFYSKLPKVFARSGFYENFFMVGQWFPKIGVLWNGKWNCHQYHLNSEFFADFGVYEVELTIPEEYVVGATGKRMKEVKNKDNTKTYTYYQQDIHDFAWTACPDFVEFKEKFTLDNPQVDTEIILLIHRSHLNQKERYLSSLKKGIEFYSQNYGPYPYPTITLVDPPFAASGAGGMEYPTLFTSMTVSFLPRGLRFPEMATIHEFGHNYWYGMVGSNEFEEAWLDEGINSYSEIKAMAHYYGKESSMLDFMGLNISDFIYHRAQVVGSGRMDPILKNSWEYFSSGSYTMNCYSKAALMLLTLENYLGEKVMSRVMRTYFERWKFRHPRSKDFIEVAEEVSGQDLSWFFNQFLYSPDKLDYAIGSMNSWPLENAEEKFKENKEAAKEGLSRESWQKEKMFRNEVVVVRKEELVFPQEILIEFENGEKILEKWDGKERWKRFVYIKPYKLRSARLDPEEKILLDVNFKNNSLLAKPNRLSPLKYALKTMLGFQSFLSFVSF